MGGSSYIIPDSITLPEHEPLRRMLLENTAVTYLIRAGEGLFPSVYRGAFFVGFVKQVSGEDHQVRVATLRKADRKLLEGDTLLEPMRTVAEIVAEGGHQIAQSRFRQNPRYGIDILATSIDTPIAARIDAPCVAWPSLMGKGRGVEIGKSGEVLQCPFCYRWDNVPRKVKGKWKPKTCRHCRREFPYEKAADHEIIIAEIAGRKRWKPRISGESVNRYCLGPVQYIDAEKDGINYKDPEFYEGTRLLLRQTGVGIYATIDDSGQAYEPVGIHLETPRRPRSPAVELSLGVRSRTAAILV